VNDHTNERRKEIGNERAMGLSMGTLTGSRVEGGRIRAGSVEKGKRSQTVAIGGVNKEGKREPIRKRY